MLESLGFGGEKAGEERIKQRAGNALNFRSLIRWIAVANGDESTSIYHYFVISNSLTLIVHVSVASLVAGRLLAMQ